MTDEPAAPESEPAVEDMYQDPPPRVITVSVDADDDTYFALATAIWAAAEASGAPSTVGVEDPDQWHRWFAEQYPPSEQDAEIPETL